MNDSLVKSLSDSSVVHDSELIAGFFSPLGFAGFILLLVLFNHALFSEMVIWMHDYHMYPLLDKGKALKARLVGYVCILTMVAGHLTEIVIWATALVVTGLIPSMSTALYYSGSTYTTLGYGRDPMADGRNAITVIIALSGMMTIAVTTSILMAQFSRYHESRRNARSKASAP